jgi:O-antigen ligase
MTASTRPKPGDRLALAGTVALMGFAAALQISIAASQLLLTAAIVCWVGSLVLNREKPEVPPIFWPLAAYGGVTLVSVAFSIDPWTSFLDSKQLLLFLVVPAVYGLARGRHATTLLYVVISVGAITAAIGIVQYAILHYDHLGQRPQGTMGHYMTYSGLLMLVAVSALATALYGRGDRIWPALVMPALLVALSVTFTRSAWIGTGLAVGVLLAIRNLKLLLVVPIVVALFLVAAPSGITGRIYSIFDPLNPTNRDRVAMLHAGAAMIREHPITGVGPNMVERVYPDYRHALAVEPVNPHLHNVPVQIAAERGIPALAVWLWFIANAAILTGRKLRTGDRFLPAVGLAAIVGMLGAGMFEHNFGDSEFLMLFLTLLTLPFAAEKGEEAKGANSSSVSVQACVN